ncbi:DNA methyltransferase [Campylobacter sp. LR264d]|uniref:DNA methyltransferase n=1 Tax=Campylobacter sp. LR264d TaxID=2593544 RepID=UPI001CC1C5D6|nr:DNA methyltransferase [Campylobacter sp. LR264d]
MEIDRILIKETKNGFSVLRKEFIESKFVKQKENGEFYAILDKLSPPKSFIDFIGSGKGTSELKDIFNNKVFNNPKPTNLIKHLLKISTNKDSIILDFFAGSGTTAQAVMELNAEDGGKRECILVTNNENNIAINVTRERLYRIINGKGSKGEDIKWQYSKDKKCLEGNSVRVFEIETHELSLNDLEKAQDLTNIAKGELQKLNPEYDINDELKIYSELASLNPQKDK